MMWKTGILRMATTLGGPYPYNLSVTLTRLMVTTVRLLVLIAIVSRECIVYNKTRATL